MPYFKEKPSYLRPVTVGYRKEPELPVIGITIQTENSQSAASHHHPRGQLIFAISGVLHVIAQNESWVVPPTQAVWIPPNVSHNVSFPGQVSLASLFFSADACRFLATKCQVLKVSGLLREMILKACEFGDHYTALSAQYRFMWVLIDQLATAVVSELNLPAANDHRITKIIENLIAKPRATRKIAELAKLVHISERTLARLFIKETGLTLGEWNNRLLIQKAVEQLHNGKSVTTIALDLGYTNPSSFIEMFKKSTGMSPGRMSRDF
jgi:AraC-like DNA-binding protein